MAGINIGILTNTLPVSAERIEEMEKQVIEEQKSFAYLDENKKLCFILPCDTDIIKELAWHNVHEISRASDTLIKKIYKKQGLKSYVLEEILYKQAIQDPWSAYMSVKFILADDGAFITSDGLIFKTRKD